MSEPRRVWDLAPRVILFRLRGVGIRLRRATSPAERRSCRAEREALIARGVILRAGRDYRRAYDASAEKSWLHDPVLRGEAGRLLERRGAYVEALDLAAWLGGRPA